MSEWKHSWRSLLVEPWLPPVRTLQNYRWADLPHDLIAGLTVAVVDLPQSMAFALIAGLDPLHGLYAAIVLGFTGALFTSSRFLSVGPTNTQCLLIASILARYAHVNDPSDPNLYVHLAIGLSLIKGLMQLAFFALRMGRMIRYVSRSVMVGFTAAAGVLIVAEQVPSFLGIRAERTAETFPGLPGVIQRLAPALGEVDPRAVGIGVGVILLVVLFKRAPSYAPGPLLGVAAAAVVVWLSGWGVVGTPGALAVVGPLPGGLPEFELPHLTLRYVDELFSGALALALLGMFESVMIAKAIGLKTGQRVSADQEFFGQGFANVVASFFQCFPGSGSFSRTALQYTVGARTRLASVACAIFNATIFLLAAPLAYYIPRAALAATLFVVGFSIMEWKTIRRILASNRADGAICAITFASTLVLPLTYAIYVGIIFNILIYLGRVSRLKTSELVLTEAGTFREDPIEVSAPAEKPMLFLQFHCDLYFPLEEDLIDMLEWIKKTGAKTVVLNFRGKHSADTAALFCLERYFQTAQTDGVRVKLCGVNAELDRLMEDFGLFKLVGRDQVYATEATAYAAATKEVELHKQAPVPDSVVAAATAAP